MGSTSAYPVRPPFFAAKFVRLMTKLCLANEHGPAVFTLLTVVVTTEDSRKYTGPVTFWDQQLMPLVGANSRDTLARVRDRAVAAGWLAYTAGRKGVPGSYFVVVPPAAARFTDGPVDEEPGELDGGSGEDLTAPVRKKARRKPTESAVESRQKADRISRTSLPVPVPIPSGGSEPAEPASGEGVEPKEAKQKPKAKSERKPRPRDELFDAVAEVTGTDPGAQGKLIGKMVSDLRAGTPAFTPAEVREFGRRFHELCPWAAEKGMTRPTVGTLRNHVHLVRRKPAVPEPPGGIHPTPAPDFTDYITEPMPAPGKGGAA